MPALRVQIPQVIEKELHCIIDELADIAESAAKEFQIENLLDSQLTESEP